MAQSLLPLVMTGRLDFNQAMIPKINEGGASMHSLVFVLSLVGFGLEVAAFLLTVAVL